ncbi:MAG: DnaA N-terminal domain-containing protein [Hyphomicrobium sp.]
MDDFDRVSDLVRGLPDNYRRQATIMLSHFLEAAEAERSMTDEDRKKEAALLRLNAERAQQRQATYRRPEKKLKSLVRTGLTAKIYDSWFRSMQVERYKEGVLTVSFPVKFCRNWVQEHYVSEFLQYARLVFPRLEKVEFIVRGL